MRTFVGLVNERVSSPAQLVMFKIMQGSGVFSISIRLIAAIAACAVSVAPLHAADIRRGPRSVVLEGKIEAGDYDKLKSLYGERGHSEFSLGLSEASELHLASPGGDLAEAMKIGRLVRALKLQTLAVSGGVNPRIDGGESSVEVASRRSRWPSMAG